MTAIVTRSFQMLSDTVLSGYSVLQRIYFCSASYVLCAQELIQNAEDAGAEEIKFLYDQHSYGTQHLAHPGLAEHQVHTNSVISVLPSVHESSVLSPQGSLEHFASLPHHLVSEAEVHVATR